MTDQQASRRLGKLMEERRVSLGLRWSDVAERAEMSTEGLRAIRAGETNPQPLTRAAIEGALEWERGSVTEILRGGYPSLAVRPVPEDRPYVGTDNSSTGDQDDPIADIARLARELADAAERLQASRGAQPVDRPW